MQNYHSLLYREEEREMNSVCKVCSLILVRIDIANLFSTLESGLSHGLLFLVDYSLAHVRRLRL